MDALRNFFETLASNAVLLLVIMPAIGAGLVRVMHRAGPEAVYFTAFSNTAITLALMVVILVRIETPPADEFQFAPQISSTIGLTSGNLIVRTPVRDRDSDRDGQTPTEESAAGGPRFRMGPLLRVVRFAVGVDVVSVWHAALIVTVTLACVASLRHVPVRATSRLSWLLFTESSLLGTFVAQDALLMSACSLWSVVGLFSLMSESGTVGCREAARRFFRLQLTSSTCLLIALTGLCIGHWWMQVEPDGVLPGLRFRLWTMLRQIPDLAMSTDEAHGFWNAVSPWLFVLLGAALILRTGLPPLHGWWTRIAEHSDPRVTALMIAGWLPFGPYAAQRLLTPVFPELLGELAWRLSLWCWPGMLFLSVAALRCEHRGRRLGLIALAFQVAGLGAVFLRDPLAQRGALLLQTGGCGVLILLLLLTLKPASKARTADEAAGTPANAVTDGCEGMVSFFSGLTMVSSFFGLLLILLALFPRDGTLGLCLLIATGCLLTVLSRAAAQSLESSGIPGEVSSGVPEMETGHRPGPVVLLPLAVLVGVAAVWPVAVTGPDRTEAAPTSSMLRAAPASRA